ncbi:B3 domain-containing protein Os01g0234100-like isoform X2 [Populus nigra]|uniref:B3 domain-containing protein Os01g0234100-like isoform X2 n=1 Tax=Populus nigra TaxID=3691 RepID=UPI002B270739|nr:B3 domain-containing protein Os01g0234100-like isoform X2 [Populus nigra]
MAILEANTQQAKRGRSSKVKGSEMVLASTQTNTKKQALHNVSVKSESNKRKRGTVVNDGVKSKAMIRAIEIQASLSSEFPSLIKYMQPSHVSGGFWLGLCKKFCDEHLPNEDTVIVLEDGNGKSSQTKYLAHKSGLSGGWRGFSIDHNLVEGDVLVFHLVKPTKFKVYVVKANSAEEVDGALAILKFDSCIKQMNPYHAEAEMEYQDLEHLYLTNPEENNTMPGISNIRLISDHSENESGDFGFEITDGIRMSETVVDFKEVRSFEDFDILANGLVINYAIRASKVTTSYDNFTTWEKTLKAFLGLGMKVDFLLARLEQLINLSAKSERHKKARLEKDNAENEMRILEAKISGVEETMNRLDVVVETLEVNAENLELRFQELAKAPW